MRSLIILEVEHDETTDGVQMLAEWLVKKSRRDVWSDVVVKDYTVKIDVPACFVLDSSNT